MKIEQIPINRLNENPWRFRILSDADYESMVKSIKEKGDDALSPPIVAEIKNKLYIVDGHSRITAAADAGLKKITCKITDSVRNHHELRVMSFHLNREGYSNPLPLSDMMYEDMVLLGDIRKVADAYGISEDYITSLLKIRDLHDDTKLIIQKIIKVAKRKYQFLLNQITPSHLSSLVRLPPEKQVEVVDWIFQDIMYGPSDESLISIPSVYEIINEIENIASQKEKKTYRKKTHDLVASEISFTCKCGSAYNIAKSGVIYECVEQNDVIVKRQFNATKIFSSSEYTKKELIDLIEKINDEFELMLIVSKSESR
ncbi:MAG: ParB N-terminal domain-containing protein [Candidatus Nitrosotenuis sp.]